MENSLDFMGGWSFQILPFSAGVEEARGQADNFLPVELPHDWLIGEPGKLNGEVGESGWYRKRFLVPETNSEEWILLFDGVYMDSAVYLNGEKVGSWHNGYTCFEVNLTAALKSGDNELFVRANYETPNSRWYSGAGIYRSVRLKKRKDCYLETDGLYVCANEEDGGWKVTVTGEFQCPRNVMAVQRLYRYQTDREIGQTVTFELEASDLPQRKTLEFFVEEPEIWDLETPALYELLIEITEGGMVLDRGAARFGFRKTEFKPDSGFWLNGRHRKLKGVCEHHDLGCLGSAFNEAAMRRKFELLKEMGVNAIRISHNMPSRETVRLADEMGFLLVTELYDMWERSKTKYDFARFFEESWKKDVAAWVRRDRNCPSVFMWSIGNEIYDTHVSERGQDITRMLMDEVKKHDPNENARVTLASNYMPWENAKKCADIVKLAGYNYGEKYYREDHERHPDWVIYGSETASVVQSRGVYHFPKARGILTDDDRQCSSLGNSITSWGAPSAEACILEERDHSFSCGQFIWSGFDYIGEPTPYHTKNSYFGQIDTAGFPKDSYYLYQSAWTDYRVKPMIHILPYWDFNDGQLVDVGIYSNAPVVELFVNGESRNRQTIDHVNGDRVSAWWRLPYEKGSLLGIAYDENGREIARQERVSFGDGVKILLTPHKERLSGDGKDLIFLTLEMEDINGRKVENANNRVKIEVEGAGWLLGLDNGNSTDYESYQSSSKRLFAGKLLAVIGGHGEGEIIVKAWSPGMPEARIRLWADKPVYLGNFLLSEASGKGSEARKEMGRETKEMHGNESWTREIPVRKIEINSPSGNRLSGECREMELEAVIYPEDADYQEVEWQVTDELGIPSHIARLIPQGKRAKIQALGDGTCVVRCMSKNGGDEISLISQLDFSVTGLGSLCLNPYEFLSAGLYTYSHGIVGNGNERGIATARDGETCVGYENLDFGSYGSDEITVPVFALTDEAYHIEIWEGIPGSEGSGLLASVMYQKPSIWNVYQEETFRLDRRLKGITTLCFVLRQKVHIKGFSFKRPDRASGRINASEADRIYGDRFCKENEWVKGIGNNVSLEFARMDFNGKDIREIYVCGGSRLERNSIHLRFRGEDEEWVRLLEFIGSENETERVFALEVKPGVWDITFLFLPGSDFDFHCFEFR